ncbi:Aspartate--tRNA ligase [Buchnera aphidicola (Tetraneura ulmi)]|uniref:aspartate--tRNA ligase n=1 Tax=Buchnera aphidicola TaxID=9 RepID=UPI003463F09A
MRTHYCGELKEINIDKFVTLCGWVHSYRNLSKIIFLNMRDWSGIIQITFLEENKKLFKVAKKLKNEFCIQVFGIVKRRNLKNINKSIKTGFIEVLVKKLTIINASQPIPIDNSKINSEDISLKYRYLELRKLELLKKLKIRSKTILLIHKYMQSKKFMQIETPILTKITPEGARNYLIPSRIHKKKFYALPQSPQLFKQLLMISGIDKYYQITKCFRDEDLRSDRQPEFSQIDIEAAFISEQKIQKIVENLISFIWLKIKNITFEKIKKITFTQSIKDYGTDKPDLRNPMKLFDLKDLLQEVENLDFIKKNIESTKKTRIAAICVPNGIVLKEKKIKVLKEELKKKYGFYELITILVKEKKLSENYDFDCSILKNYTKKKIILKIIKKINAKSKDLIIIVIGISKTVNNVLNKLRMEIGIKLNLVNPNEFKPVWITDFPMFKKEKDGKLCCLHHPFTQPKNSNIETMKRKPETIISKSYDLVINGYEIAGGSVRNHNFEVQKTIFKLIGISEKEQLEKFGFFLESLTYGAPIHAGIALGLDRIIMLLTNSNSIRDTIAFPKTTSAICPMTNSPDYISNDMLKEIL